MATRLRKLKITRIACCEQGANPDADIVLFKSAETLAHPVAPPATVGEAPNASPPPAPTPVVVPGRRVSSQIRPPLVLKADYAEPDGDEAPPLDYATRSRQQDLWRCLWDKWERFCGTFYDCIGDADTDNVPHLSILVASIGQFQEDVASLLTDLGLAKQVAPLFADLSTVSKAGAAMAGHRLTRLKAAIEALQAIFEECTPPEIEHDGISAAEAAGIPGAINGRVPGSTSMPVAMGKGGSMAGVRKESDQEHCDHCEDKDCDNPAHDRLKKEVTKVTIEAGSVAQAQIDTLTHRAETAEARVKELDPLVAKTAELETTIAKMRQTPEEQEAEYLASLPESVKKRYEADQLEKVELRKRLQDADERAERTEYIQKTAGFRNVGMVPDDHWAILKAIDGMPDAQRDELLRLLKAANAQLQTSSLFSAAGVEGRSAQGSDGSGSAESQIMGLAQAYATEKGVMLDKAIEAIAKQHPDLWARDQQEKRFTNRVNSR